MSDRPCNECVWRSETGCTNWHCEPLTRKKLREMLKAGYVVIETDKLEANDG